MPVGEKIKKEIKDRGLTIKQFAEEIGENRSLLSNYLNGKTKPSVKFLYKVISYFPDLDLNYLFRDAAEVQEAMPVYKKSPDVLIQEIEERLAALRRLMNED